MASLATDDKGNENVTTTEATTTDTPASTTTTTTTNTTNKKKRKKKKKKKKTTSINNNADNNNNNNNNNDKQLVAKTNNNATTNRSGKTVDPIAAALGNMNLSEAEKRKMFQAMFGRSKMKGPAAVEAASRWRCSWLRWPGWPPRRRRTAPECAGPPAGSECAAWCRACWSRSAES